MEFHRALVWCLVFQVIGISTVSAQVFSLTPSTNSITVSWTGSATPVYTSFTIEVDGTLVYNGMGARLQMDDSELLPGLTPGTQYNIMLYGDGSLISSVTQHTAPLPVTDIQISLVGNQLTLMWSAGVGSTQDRYMVAYRDTEDSNAALMGNLTTMTSSLTISLSYGHNYDIWVWAQSGDVYSEPLMTTRGIPFGAVSITPITMVTTTSIQVGWTAVTGATSYMISHQDQDTGDPAQEASVGSSSTSHNIGNLKAGHQYLITVTATSGDISNSDTVSQNTVPNSPVLNVVSAIDGSTLYAEWTPNADSIQDSFLVQFYLGTNTGDIKTATGCGLTNCTIDASMFPPGSQVVVSVAAVRGSQMSTATVRAGNTQPAPVPSLELKESTLTSLAITWDAVVPASSYRVTIVPDDGYMVQGTQQEEYQRSNLNPGHQYTFNVYTVSNTEESLPTSAAFFTKPMAPGAPTLQTVTTTSLTVTWPSQDGDASLAFRVTITKTSDQSTPAISEVIAESGSNTATFNGLVPGAQYTVQVRSTVDQGNVESDLSQANFYTVPSIPTMLEVISLSTNTLKVWWSGPAAMPTNEFTGFWVQLANEPSTRQTFSSSSSPLEATFNGLQPGTLYTVEVATTADGSQYSEVITGQQHTKPTAPGNLHQIIVTTISLTVEWSPPPNTNFDSYIITLEQGATDVSSEILTIEDGLSHTFEGLSPATEYIVFLETVIASVSSEQQRITLNTKPNPPVRPMVTAKTTSSASLAWSAPDQMVAVDNYVITYGVIGQTGATITMDVDGLVVMIINLEAGATYSVSVHAVKSTVQSEPVTVEVTLIPNAPTGLTQTYIGQTNVDVVWLVPENSVFTGFHLSVESGATVASSKDVGSSTTSSELVGLSAGVSYTVYLLALSGVEESARTSLAINTLPLGVASMEVEDTTTDSIAVSWSEPVGTSLSRYELSISPNDGSATLPITVNRDDSLRHTFSNLHPGVSYMLSIQVIANNQASDTITRAISTVPATVLNLMTTTISGTVIEVTWGVDQGSTQQSFEVTYGVEGTSQTLSVNHVGQLSYTQRLSSLSPGFLYTISVLALSNEQSSDPRTAMQTTDPDPVTRLTATVESATTVRLSWTPGDGRQDHFQYRYTGSLVASNPAWTSLVQTTEVSLLLEGLFPGEVYTFEVSAMAGGRISATSTIHATMYPLPPTGLTVTSDETFLEIEWNVDMAATHVTSWEYRYQVFGTSIWTEVQLTQVTPTKAVIANLMPGQTYAIEVYTVTQGGVQSQTPASMEATTVPVCNTVPLESVTSTTNQQIAVDYNPNSGSEFDEYVFHINISNIPATVKRRDDEDRTVLFTEGITNGTYYTVSMAVRSGDQSSSTQTTSIISNPYRPSVQAAQSADQIELIITKAVGGTQEYRTTCSRSGANCGEKLMAADPSDITRILYNGLNPNTAYDFTVVALVGRSGSYAGKESNVVHQSARTQESEPGPVSFFNHSMSNSTQVILTWGPPLAPNGVITGYQVWRSEVEPKKILQASDSSTTFTGLQGGNTYIFMIQAATSIGYGVLTTYTIETEVSDPAIVLPIGQAQPAVMGSPKQNSFVVRLVDAFSEDNGAITGYAVIVAKRNDLSLSNNPPRWSMARRNNLDYYQATDSCALNRLPSCSSGVSRRKRATGETIDFTVGSDSCDEQNLDIYCNGPVEEDTDYYVALRAYTSRGHYTDGPFSSPIHTAPNNLIWYIVGAVAGVVLIVIFTLLAIYLARRGFGRHDEEKGRAIPMSPDRRSGRRKTLADTSRSVKTVDFIDHARDMAKDQDFRYSEEFEDLKQVGKEQPTLAAEFPVNRQKNRFTNILPYDHSRVKLLSIDDDDGSDYVNANYMPGFNSKREFIVSQGCLPSTRDDFWRMVWEQNCRAIVMLTKCVEKGREKCDHYWPVDSEPMFYGDLQVQILNETKCPTWIVTEFTIAMGENSRKMIHFHYIDWPDFGVPKRPQSLVSFVRLVRSRLTSHGGPIVVHCSAGVGRSGAYIALDHVLQAVLAKQEHIDVYGLVHDMRKYRTCMVQTEQQYICIHNCIVCVLEGNEEDVPFHGEDNPGYNYDIDDEGITLE